jgi:hypothetical protein
MRYEVLSKRLFLRMQPLLIRRKLNLGIMGDTMAQESRFSRFIVLLLVFFSFFMSALVSRTVFERLPHLEDEVAYLFQSRIFARGDVVIETPQPRQAYWQPFVVDFGGQRFGKYTPGWPLLLSAGILLGQPWVVNALLGALTVALVYRLGREIFNTDVGIIAAALTAFSPMALLLNATLMGHTAALFCVTLFMYAYWRIVQARQALRWGIIAGIALGLVIINRPLTGVAVALPFVAWSGIRVVLMVLRSHQEFIAFDYEKTKPTETPTSGTWVEPSSLTHVLIILRPLVALAGVALLISAAIPLFNYAATGNPRTNLYTLVWEYDQVGFGYGYGRHVHSLEKGFRHVRFDLSLTAADMFGWQLGAITAELQEHLRSEDDYWPVIGISWILLPVGLLIGLWRQRVFAGIWILVGAIIVSLTPSLPSILIQDPDFAWLWLRVGILWMVIPLAVFARQDKRIVWAWLLFSVIVVLVGVHLAYWIGSQRYSTRYYFEALTAVSLLSALPLAWLARRMKRWLVYVLVGAALLWSLYGYSTPRISALYHFNHVEQDHIDAVLARRDGDRPVLVLVHGNDVRWRALGSLMALTSPYLDSEIVVAWDTLVPGMADEILARFPDRQVIEMDAVGNDATFRDDDSG